MKITVSLKQAQKISSDSMVYTYQYIVYLKCGYNCPKSKNASGICRCHLPPKADGMYSQRDYNGNLEKQTVTYSHGIG